MAARIYQRPLSAMSSGKAHADEWLLEFDASDRKVHDPMTGWTGSSDTREQLLLRFDTKSDAVAYAERMGIDAVIEPARVHRLKLQAYADNFR